MSGFFIVIDGPDGCGKSTQTKLLHQYLISQGYETILTKDPGGTKVAEAIKKILLDPQFQEMSAKTELLLYMAARNQLIDEVIKSALKEEKIIISDRFTSSTFVYQGIAGKLGKDIVSQIGTFVTGGIEPDLTFILDVEAEVGLSRSEKTDRMEKKPIEFHRLVRQGFLSFAKEDKKRRIVIEPHLSIQEVHQKIKERLDQELRYRLRKSK